MLNAGQISLSSLHDPSMISSILRHANCLALEKELHVSRQRHSCPHDENIFYEDFLTPSTRFLFQHGSPNSPQWGHPCLFCLRILRRNVLSSLLAAAMFPQLGFNGVAIAKTQNEFKEYIDVFDGYSLLCSPESSILSTSSRVADDGKLYYLVEVNIKSYANNNEMAIMPLDRISQLEWDRRYLSVLGVGNNRLYELRLQTPESVFLEEEDDLRDVMNSFRVINSVD
ncbi:hypothetical protein HPP92_016484 [Vanilla planifolia]|uniref:PsbP C-terminal domain-containing protein n=1 Tax=Vanilla planifolia TaxID=51239 RepID=A0A835US47_VANPL|nr:hypothetical protein HPP92_016484 [Vanilla planifolia]